MARRQVSGQEWTYKCGHVDPCLPEIGKSGEFSLWINSKKYSRGGYFKCTTCNNERSRSQGVGTGRRGLLGRAARLLTEGRFNAKRRGFTAPNITSRDLVSLFHSQEGKCAVCSLPISFEMRGNARVDHCHTTGAVRAFLCNNCNMAEGYIKDYNDMQLYSLIEYIQNNRTPS